MDTSFDFHPMYPRHDLLIEIAQVEMAIDDLDECDARERIEMQPSLESRMHSLMDALDHLAV